MASISTIDFIKTSINRSSIVTPTKVDSTLKALINSLKEKSTILVDYLNTLRIVYYMKRLSYYNNSKYKATLSKFLSYSYLL
jgi:hypothetical protein